MLERVVPVEDKDVSTVLEKSLTKQGMTIRTGAGVEDLKATASSVTAKIKDKSGKVADHEFTHCIVAIGIVPNTENIGIEKLADTDRGFIKLDTSGRTKRSEESRVGKGCASPCRSRRRPAN